LAHDYMRLKPGLLNLHFRTGFRVYGHPPPLYHSTQLYYTSWN
ncbi:MAG: hypothetical protein ACI9MF_002845, partial [Gammaproteobacteria bacterium]